MTDETTATAEPSTLEKMAQNLIGTSRRADDAMGDLHSSIEGLLSAAHDLIQFLLADNARIAEELYEANGRLAGLDK